MYIMDNTITISKFNTISDFNAFNNLYKIKKPTDGSSNSEWNRYSLIYEYFKNKTFECTSQNGLNEVKVNLNDVVDPNTTNETRVYNLSDECVLKFSTDKSQYIGFYIQGYLASLNNSPVNPVVDIGSCKINNKDGVFALMEKGTQTLDIFIKNNNRTLDYVKVKSILINILKAVDFIHKQNFVHLDLKPQNILIDDKYNIQIIDFEYTRIIGTENISAIFGTRCYKKTEIDNQININADFQAIATIIFVNQDDSLCNGLYSLVDLITDEDYNKNVQDIIKKIYLLFVNNLGPDNNLINKVIKILNPSLFRRVFKIAGSRRRQKRKSTKRRTKRKLRRKNTKK